MWLFIQRLSFLVLGLTACLSQGQLFTFGVPPDEGPCSSDQQGKIETFISDSKTLVGDALWAISQKESRNPAVLGFFTSYFGIKWKPDYSGFRDRQSSSAWNTVECKNTHP